MSLTANRLIGRQEACDRLEAMLVPGALVTLTGPGGVGKTRLAEELAVLIEVRTGQPVPVGLLSEMATDAGADAVADALGFESVSAAIVVLTERPATIVLDNCEHVLAAVRQLVAAVRSAVPSITVLTTTREPLGLMGERGTNARMTAEIGLPACRAVLAFTEDRHADVVAELFPIRRVFQHFGGSHAQRDALQRTLLESALRARRYDLAPRPHRRALRRS